MTIVPLDSYRLARYARPVPCFICGEDNMYDTDRCRHCRAPFALTYQIAGQKRAPNMVAVLSPPRSGKTSFLGMLTDMLSHRSEDLQLTSRGAFSVALQQAAITSLAEGWFPPPTPSDPVGWNWVHCRVRAKRRKHVELLVPDISGQVLCEEIERPHSQPLVNILLRQCVSAMILLDAAQLANGDRTPDFFAMKCISYLSELNTTRHGWAGRPVAIVLTKTDTAPSAWARPTEFLQRCAPGTWLQIQQRLKQVAYFPVSIVGCAAHQRVGSNRVAFPLRVEPRGVTEPLTWLLPKLA